MKHIITREAPAGITGFAVLYDGEIHFQVEDCQEVPEAIYEARQLEDGTTEVLFAEKDFKVRHVFNGWTVPTGYEAEIDTPVVSLDQTL